MNSLEKLILLQLVLSLSCAMQNKVSDRFSGIHDNPNREIAKFMDRNGYSRITYYFDEIEQRDGEWNLFPQMKISDDLYLVNVSKVPESNEYNFVIVLNTANWRVIDKMGPFHDSHAESAEIIENKNGYTVNLKIVNAPDDKRRTYTYKHDLRVPK